MAQHWKRLASAAYGYSLTRLALNVWMYFEELPRIAQTEENETFWKLLERCRRDELSREELDDFRNQIQEVMKITVAYADSFRIYEYALNRVERRFETGLPALGMTEAEFADQLRGFVASASDPAQANQRIQDVVGQLPIRFTRQRYYGLVQEALLVFLGADKDSLEQELYLLRTGAMIELTKEQKQAYSQLSELLETLSATSFPNLTAETFHQAQQMVTLASEKLFAASEYYQMLAEMVNDLYVLCLTKQDALKNAAEEAHALRIMDGLCALAKDGTREIPPELEEELSFLEGVQETYYEKFERLDPMPEYEAGEDPDISRSRCVELLLSTSSFAELTPKEKTGTVVRKDIEEAMAAFTERLNPVFDTVPKPVMRAIMATTLASLPVFFDSLEEFGDYCRNSLECCTDRAEKESCMELLQQLMESEDYALV
ncbi:MAG: hypothetical protein PHV18_07620 [Lachnospiraceae bacterium]|nr:hypothetical protein [Lachnospiraceae bacterium]